jgi:hypothetical protein
MRSNRQPLEDFSGLRDFCGENFAFFTAVEQWKVMWFSSLIHDAAHSHKVYTKALEIYTTYASPRDAEFPINLAWRQLKTLEDMFEQAARVMCGEARKN